MTTTAIDRLQALTQPPEIVGFFNGLFRRVGVAMTDTGETFTARHDGNAITFAPGIDTGNVDFVVEVGSAQIDRLASHVATGELGPAEEFRIVRAFLTPATRALLSHPMMASPVLRKMIGVEDLSHVRLRSPADGETDALQTLVFAAGQWIVIPGLYGIPGRVFEMDTADAVEFQRRALAAIQGNTWTDWLKFGTWYKHWRTGVSRRT